MSIAIEYCKSCIIGSPAEPIAVAVREFQIRRAVAAHPELADYRSEYRHINLAITRMARRDWNCVDVGGHLGSFTSFLVDLCRDGRHAVIEGVPRKARWLAAKFNCRAVDVYATAVGAESGTTTFFESVGAGGFSGMRRSTDARAQQVRKQTVPLARLDDVISKERTTDMLKVDVEGAELDVFAGARRLLEVQRPVLLFECTRSNLAMYGRTCADVYEFTRQAGYRLYLPGDLTAGHPPVADAAALEKGQTYPFRYANLFALPVEKPELAVRAAGRT